MINNGPWKIKKSEEKYKNPWISVREDIVIRPDGKKGICGVVDMLNGVYILPLDDEGYVYIIDQFRYVMGRNIIETAGGSLKKTEDPLETAKRELLEETGITAGDWIFLGTIHPLTAVVKSSSNLYLAKNLNFFQASPEGTEKIKVIKVKLEEAIRMVMDGIINSGPSCTLILKVNEYLKSLSK